MPVISKVLVAAVDEFDKSTGIVKFLVGDIGVLDSVILRLVDNKVDAVEFDK